MEKLIELLNEWSKTAIENKCNWADVYDEDGVYFVNLFDRDMTMEIEDVISKRNGFIKRLVENNKIDKRKIDTRLVKNVESHYDVDGWWVEDSYEDYSDTDTLLMLLSISNSPIEDLLLYLK